MVWARIDDRANSSAKLLALSDTAWRLWGCGLIYCQANLTDGFIPHHAILTFGLRGKPKPAVDELCAVLVTGRKPLWHRVEGGFMVNDYLDWNESREEIETGRAASHERKERWRERHKNGQQDAAGTVPERVPRRSRNTASGTTTNSSTPTDLSEERKGLSVPTRQLLTHFDTRYRACFGVKAPIVPGKDPKRLAVLWRDRVGDPVTVEALIDAFFASRDPFIQQAGYSIGVFISQVPKLVPLVARTVTTTLPLEDDWRAACQRDHGGRCTNPTFHAAQCAADARRSA